MHVHEEGHLEGQTISFYHGQSSPHGLPADRDTVEIPAEHHKPNGQPRMRGTGVWLYSEDGTRYLDAVSGTFNLALGYDHPQVLREVGEQLERISHVSSHFGTKKLDSVKQKLLAFAPPSIDSVWLRDVTGSTAVEGAIKIAQKATGKSGVISLFRSHHGQTMYATAISGNAFRRANQPDASVASSLKVPAPYCHRCFYQARHPECDLLCVSKIQDFIDFASNGRLAAIIVEPVQGNGGNIVPPIGYFSRLRELCDKNGMLLIVDEVQTGIGRTGQMYASNTFDIKPDIMVLAKGLGGIGIPVGAILMRAAYATLETHEHSFTSGANLLALTAAEATLDVVGAPGFLANVRRKAARLRRELEAIQDASKIISDVRGIGFMWGLEIVDRSGRPAPHLANRIIDRALKHYGLVLRGSLYGRGNVIKVRPALVATEPELIEISLRLASAISDVERDLGG